MLVFSRSSWLYLSSARIRGICHYTQQSFLLRSFPTNNSLISMFSCVLGISSAACFSVLFISWVLNQLHNLLNPFLIISLFSVHRNFAFVYVCARHAYSVSMEARRRCQIPFNCSYKQLWSTIWVLGIDPSVSARVASTFHCWASCLGPQEASWWKE